MTFFAKLDATQVYRLTHMTGVVESGASKRYECAVILNRRTD